MKRNMEKREFVSRPVDPDGWVRAGDTAVNRKTADFTARLTIDITPALRGRIKVAAFRGGMTVADMLRELLAREFPDAEGDGS